MAKRGQKIDELYLDIGLNIAQLQLDFDTAGKTVSDSIARLNSKANNIHLKLDADLAKLDGVGTELDKIKVRHQAINRELDIQRQKEQILAAVLQSAKKNDGADSASYRRAESNLLRQQRTVAQTEAEVRKLNNRLKESAVLSGTLGVRISAGEGSLTASWTPGAAVPGTQTVYRVVFHSDNGDITRTTTGTSLSIGAADGVHAGGSYSVTVTAVARSGDSEVGSSKGVSSGSSATPYGKPGDFEVTNVVQTSSGVTVYWQGASANHAGPVSYTVNVSGPESHTVNAGSGLSSSIKLSASGTYTFTVTATTKAGSTASRNSKSLNVDLRSKPPAPSGLRATASDTVPNQVTASASTQSGNGWSEGDLTIEYKVGDRGWTSSATFDGLRTGQNVTVSARAYGTRGDGQTVYSDVATSSVTVVGHPADPDVRCDDVASDGTLWCSWTDSPSSGSPNPDITYSAFETAASEAPLPGGQWQDPAGRTLTTSVPEGQSRGWCVVATNNYGFSSQDCEWEKNSHQQHHHQPQAKQAG